MTNEDDRRQGFRAPIELKVEYKRLNTFFADYTRNISRGGTFIGTDKPLKVGTEFVFALGIPHMAEPLRLRGKVIWTTDIEDATKAIPQNVDLLNDLAGLLFTAGRHDEAIATYERVIALQPDSDFAINNFAAITADYLRNDPAALDKALNLATRFRTSNNPLFLDTLGWLYYRKGDYAVAATYLERATNLAPDRTDLRYHLGMALARSGQSERAITELRRVVAANMQEFDGLAEAKAMLAELEKAQEQPSSASARGANG